MLLNDYGTYSMSLNQALTVICNLNTSSSASFEQCAIGPLSVFNWLITFSTAFILLKIVWKITQLDLIISPNSPNVVKSIGSSERTVTPESFSRCILFLTSSFTFFEELYHSTMVHLTLPKSLILDPELIFLNNRKFRNAWPFLLPLSGLPIQIVGNKYYPYRSFVFYDLNQF